MQNSNYGYDCASHRKLRRDDLARAHCVTLSADATAASGYMVATNGNRSALNRAYTYDAIGNPAAAYRYDPYGQFVSATGPEKDRFRHRFSTKPQDKETGLLYYGYRYLETTTGRWPSRDPIGERGGINLYGFVYNSPWNWIDILGREPAISCLTGNPVDSGAPLSSHGAGADPQFAPTDPNYSPNSPRCCNAETIDKGEVELRERYEKMMDEFKNNDIKPFGKGRGSCKNRAVGTMMVLSPVPKCWECKEKRGFSGRMTWFARDHVWVECKSNPNDGSEAREIAFDSWSGHNDGVDPSVPQGDYSHPGTVQDPSHVHHNTCDREIPYNFPDIIDTQRWEI